MKLWVDGGTKYTKRNTVKPPFRKLIFTKNSIDNGCFIIWTKMHGWINCHIFFFADTEKHLTEVKNVQRYQYVQYYNQIIVPLFGLHTSIALIFSFIKLKTWITESISNNDYMTLNYKNQVKTIHKC